VPYCPRCGLEVSDETVHCPRCGTEIHYRKVAAEPERRGAMAHLKYAVSVARDKPMVFGPSLVEVMIAFVNQRIIESWAVYNDFIDAIWDYFYSQTGVSPVSYVSTGFEFDYTRFIGWVPIALILLSLLSWVASLASIRASWRAVRGEEPMFQESFLFVGKRFLRFVYASILMTAFFVLASGVAVIPLFFMESMGGGYVSLIFFVVMVGMMVFAILAAPTFILMIGEDEGFIPSLRKTIRFTRGSFWTYIGLGILLVLFAFGLGLVPYVGYYLSFIIGAVGNIAIIDLYNQYRVASELR
jgi:hypothetical protein